MLFGVVVVIAVVAFAVGSETIDPVTTGTREHASVFVGAGLDVEVPHDQDRGLGPIVPGPLLWIPALVCAREQ